MTLACRSANAKQRSAERRAAIAASGLTPLDFMLKLLRCETIKIPGERKKYRPTIDDMKWAAAAASYVHPRLQAVEVGGPGGGAIKTEIAHGCALYLHQSTIVHLVAAAVWTGIER